MTCTSIFSYFTRSNRTLQIMYLIGYIYPMQITNNIYQSYNTCYYNGILLYDRDKGKVIKYMWPDLLKLSTYAHNDKVLFSSQIDSAFNSLTIH